MNIEFDSEPLFDGNDKYTKTKIKMYRVNTNFQGKKVPKENASYKCLSLIMLDSVIRVNEKYCPQTLLVIRYVIKNNEMEKFINDDLDLGSSDQSDNEPDNECDNESDNETEMRLMINFGNASDNNESSDYFLKDRIVF